VASGTIPAGAKESGKLGGVSPCALPISLVVPMHWHPLYRFPTFTLFLLDDSGQQRSDNLGQGAQATGVGVTSDRYDDTSDQYGGRERFTSDQTSGYTDPTTGRTGYAERDDGLSGAGGGGKPSATSKLMGTSLLA
jgi:hypothetical protein